MDPLFAGEVGRGGVPRDRQGRALLRPKGTNLTLPYTAASALAEYLTDDRWLSRHQERLVARGIGLREDLAALAAASPWTPDFEDPEDRRDRTNAQYGRELDEIIVRAKDAAGADIKADWGTAVHRFAEPAMADHPVPTRMQADIAAWRRAIRGIEIVATELFVACDELMSAGTLDHLARIPGIPGLVVLDNKTGRIKPFELGIQTSTYANGEIYDRETGERTTFEEAFGESVNLETAVLGWIPAGEGKVVFKTIDIEQGYRNALLATQVRLTREESHRLGKEIDLAALARVKAADLISAATTPQEMSAIYQQFKDVWTDDLTALGRERLS